MKTKILAYFQICISVLYNAVYKWFFILRSENIPISGPMLKEKALEFAGRLKIEGFQASEGWLEKWKKR